MGCFVYLYIPSQPELAIIFPFLLTTTNYYIYLIYYGVHAMLSTFLLYYNLTMLNNLQFSFAPLLMTTDNLGDDCQCQATFPSWKRFHASASTTQDKCQTTSVLLIAHTGYTWRFLVISTSLVNGWCCFWWVLSPCTFWLTSYMFWIFTYVVVE